MGVLQGLDFGVEYSLRQGLNKSLTILEIC